MKKSGQARKGHSAKVSSRSAKKASFAPEGYLADVTIGGIGITEQGKIIKANGELARMLGAKVSDLLGKPVSNFMAPESVEEVMRHIQSSSEKPYVLTAQRKDGSRFPVEVRARKVIYRGRNVSVAVVQNITERKRVEAELLNLRKAVLASGEAVFMTDRDGVFTFVNPEFTRLYGYADTEIVGKSTPRILKSGRMKSEDYERFWGALLNRQMVKGELINKTKDGRFVNAEVSVNPILDDDQNITGFLAIHRDITERKRAEETLRDGERMLRESQSIAGLGSYVLDISTGEWKSSEVLDKIFGIDETFLRSVEGWASIVHPDWRELMLNYFKDEVLAKRVRFDKEYKIIRIENKEERWVHGIGELEFDSENKPIKLTGSILDITERKQTEEVIHRQKAYFQNLFENSTIPIAMLDKSEMILEINKAFESTFQYKHEEITGKNINDVIVPDSLKDEAKELSDKARNKQNIQKETERKRKDGTLVKVSVNGFPIIIDGELAGIYGAYEDISERKKLEKQFLHAQRMESVGTLASGIAHDFNNVLGIIMAYVSLLKRGGVNPEESSSYLSVILQAVDRGSKLARQILTFARKGDVIMEDVRVNDILMDLSKMLQETFPKDIELRFDLDSSISPVAIDSGQFHQAMLNLCVNARDAVLDTVKQGGGNGSITIKTRLVSAGELIGHKISAPAGSYVAIAVSDTGSGMSEETKQRIFEPFFTTKDLGRGTGLGLAVVYGIVKSHHGYIDVKTEIGRGTEFTLYFPARRTQSKDKTPLMHGLREAPGGSETILIVEDEMALLELLKNLFLNKGYIVLTAQNGLEAVEVFTRNKDSIHLVLSDHGLPKMSGSEAYRRMKELNPKVKIVLASGYVEPGQKSDMNDIGIREFVQKPYDPHEILRKVREVLDG